MGTKIQPGTFDAYAKALPDEPLFVLLARDRSAPTMLRVWADDRRRHVREDAGDGEYTEHHVEDLRKATEADACADDMEIWRRANVGNWQQGGERRPTCVPPTQEQADVVREGAVKAVARFIGLTSDKLTQLQLSWFTYRHWASPLFSGFRYEIEVKGPGLHTIPLDGMITYDLFDLTGQHVADVSTRLISEHLVQIDLLTVPA